jgi:CRISPR-associated protein Cmr6
LLTQCRNPGLLFTRYAPDWRTDATLKRRGLEAVRDTRPDAELLRAFRERWRTVVTSQQARIFEAVADWRLIVGLGQKGPLEVGFAFHRLYGIPMIPGSALKGLARAYAHLVEGRDETDADFRVVFGRTPKPGEEQSQARAGGAIFFDAIPVSHPALDLDVMNPHYPDYYRGDAPPANWQSPVPIYFLTLKPEVRFAFAVGWRREVDDEAQRLLSLAIEWLKGGLQELGAGAKTGAGYGYFEVPETVPSAPPAEAVIMEPAQPEPEPSLTWRSGTVRHYHPDKGYGRLVDDETGEELSFRRDAIEEKGWSPGKKHKVRYAVVEQEERPVVVRIRRA